MTQKPHATLRKWTAVPIYDDILIMGEIHGDTKGRWPDGTPIQTSYVVKGTFRDGEIVTTRNTRYLLEDQYVHAI